MSAICSRQCNHSVFAIYLLAGSAGLLLSDHGTTSLVALTENPPSQFRFNVQIESIVGEFYVEQASIHDFAN